LREIGELGAQLERLPIDASYCISISRVVCLVNGRDFPEAHDQLPGNRLFLTRGVDETVRADKDTRRRIKEWCEQQPETSGDPGDANAREKRLLPDGPPAKNAIVEEEEDGNEQTADEHTNDPRQTREHGNFAWFTGHLRCPQLLLRRILVDIPRYCLLY